MAITVTKAPVLLNFAGNPIVVEAKTDLAVSGTDKSLLRVVCRVWVREYTYDNIGEELYFELSQPVEDKGTAVFNLSDCVMSRVQRIISGMDMNASGGTDVESHWNNPVKIVIQAQVYDVYLFDNQEIKGSEEVVKPDAGHSVFYAVPGRLTDFELLTFDSIILEDLSNGKMMSRKPDMGVVYKGETVIVPVVNSGSINSSELLVSINGVEVERFSDALSSYSLDYQQVSLSHTSDGELTVTSTRGGKKNGYYRTNTHGVHFLRFINGFGAVENISVRSKDKLSYEVSGETYSLVQQASVRPTDRRYATKSQPVGVYELSSGYVPKKWAEWFVQELLTSPRVWIQLGGKWVPALIEAEDDCVIYDRTKPEMPHVDFTLRLAIEGVTGVTW